MESRACLAAAVAAVSLALAGCEGSADPEEQLANSPEVTGSAEESTVAAAEPERGDCWTVPGADAPVLPPLLARDDSAQVPCTEAHTTETVEVLDLDEPTIAEAESEEDLCWDYVRNHLGIDEASWVPWGYAAFLPSREQVADGASWLRCDAVFPATWAFDSLRTIEVGAEGLADHPPADFWACLDERPTKAKQPFVPCDQPHTYEETGTAAILDVDAGQYPAPAELATAARRQCPQGVPAEYRDVSVTASWDSPVNLGPNFTLIAGVCFMFSADGQPLPGR